MSQEYLLPCTCGQQLRVAPAQAGGQVSCACGRSVAVPTLRGLRELKPAPEAAPAKTVAGWSPVHGAIFAAGLLLAAAGLAVLVYHLVFYRAVSGFTVDRTEEIVHNAELESPLDKLTPLAALDEWNTQVLPGLTKALDPPWVLARKSAERYILWSKIGGGMLAGGLLAAIATLFIGRGRKT